jgi:ribosomal protein S12 methylthiotransferase
MPGPRDPAAVTQEGMGVQGSESRRARVAIVTLGCGRNEVDSDQVGGALQAAGFDIVAGAATADCVLVNTCTFIEPARRESVEVILECSDLGAPVLVIGCMAQRYGDELADVLPETADIVGFADYPRLPEIVGEAILRGIKGTPSKTGRATSKASRRSLPLVEGPSRHLAPPTAAFPVRTVPRGPWAYLKIAGGCDRVCTFCTIPSYRGRFRSRPLEELEAEARWLVSQDVRELVCVSENTTSWGKDLDGGRRAQADLVRMFERIDGLERVRLLYLQPAELTPWLLDAMASSPVVAGYYDLSLQHASASVLARMARSGNAERFLDLIESIRARDPDAVFRSSFITGFPGETVQDVDILEQFLVTAQLDWAGFFTFSLEEGTPSATMPDQVDEAEARTRRDQLVAVQEIIAEDRAERFVGREVDVLVERRDGPGAVGRSYREGPETDGEVRLPHCTMQGMPGWAIPVGRMVPVRIEATNGVDLVGMPAPAKGLGWGAAAGILPGAASLQAKRSGTGSPDQGGFIGG